jgi:hypothetical protein
MNMKKINSLAAGVAAMLFVTGATAATVSVTPTPQSTTIGGFIEANVVADFTDVGGTVGGSFSLTWDNTVLTLNEALSGASTDIEPFPGSIFIFDDSVVAVDATHNALNFTYTTCVVFGSPCNAVQSIFNVYDLHFDAVNPGTTDIVTALAIGGGNWRDENEAVIPVGDIQFNPAEFTVSAVPVPAAVWLFGSGLIGLVGIARRRKTQLA